MPRKSNADVAGSGGKFWKNVAARMKNKGQTAWPERIHKLSGNRRRMRYDIRERGTTGYQNQQRPGERPLFDGEYPLDGI